MLKAGDSFGELGVLYDVPRTATIRCTSPGHVLRIPGEHFSTHSKLGAERRHNGRVDEPTLRQLIDDVRSGAIDPDAAVERLRRLPFAEVGDALVDHHRSLRQGMPEAIYGRGKSVEQCVDIVGELLTHGVGTGAVDTCRRRAARRGDRRARSRRAGTGCGPVAAADRASHRAACWWQAPERAMSTIVDECVLTLRAYGFEPDRLADIGVAGLHRLLAHIDRVTVSRRRRGGCRDGGRAG